MEQLEQQHEKENRERVRSGQTPVSFEVWMKENEENKKKRKEKVIVTTVTIMAKSVSEI